MPNKENGIIRSTQELSGKSAEVNDIPAKLLKADIETTGKYLENLFKIICSSKFPI